MRVLLTGDRGILGTIIRDELEADGHEVTGFDLANGQDIRDAAALAEAAAGHQAIVHLAGLAGDHEEHPDQVVAINVAGTWNVLLAAEAAGVERVIHCSSGKALGMLERDPDYLPVDDEARGLPARPYALSKWLTEEMCQAFTERTGISTLCLRPVFVADETVWRQVRDLEELPPARGTAWHLGTIVDVRDVATAFAAALTCEDPGHVRLLLCSDDIGSDRPSAEVLAEKLPGVPWRGEPLEPVARTSLVDNSRAKEVLGWRPRFGWADRGGLLPGA